MSSVEIGYKISVFNAVPIADPEIGEGKPHWLTVHNVAEPNGKRAGYGLPGGGAREGEQLEITAMNELYQETGLISYSPPRVLAEHFRNCSVRHGKDVKYFRLSEEEAVPEEAWKNLPLGAEISVIEVFTYLVTDVEYEKSLLQAFLRDHKHLYDPASGLFVPFSAADGPETKQLGIVEKEIDGIGLVTFEKVSSVLSGNPRDERFYFMHAKRWERARLKLDGRFPTR